MILHGKRRVCDLGYETNYHGQEISVYLITSFKVLEMALLCEILSQVHPYEITQLVCDNPGLKSPSRSKTTTY